MIYLASVVGYFNPRIKDLWKNDRARRIPIEIFEIFQQTKTRHRHCTRIFTNLYEGEKKVRQHYENNFERTSRIEKLLRNNHWKRRKENYDFIEIRYVPS